MAVASPCINLCRINPASGLCEGCLRTLAEIAAWGTADDAARLRVLAALPLRRARLHEPSAPGARPATGGVDGLREEGR